MGTFGLEGSLCGGQLAGLVDRQGGQFRRSGDCCPPELRV